MMEARHTYIIGLSLLFGLSTDTMPSAYAQLPDWLRPIFSSGLTLATAMVVVLNAVFRIGISRRKSIQLESLRSKYTSNTRNIGGEAISVMRPLSNGLCKSARRIRPLVTERFPHDLCENSFTFVT